MSFSVLWGADFDLHSFGSNTDTIYSDVGLIEKLLVIIWRD